MLDGLAELLDHGLLRRETVAGEPRFTMPETICEYALERLRSKRRGGGGASPACDLLSDAGGGSRASDAGTRSGSLGSAARNRTSQPARGARWSLAHDPAVALRLAAALWRFWYARGHIQEGRQWLDRALATGAGEKTVARVRALNGLGVLVWTAGDLERALELQNASLSLARELGDSLGRGGGRGRPRHHRVHAGR